jgi:hypothetical protein
LKAHLLDSSKEVFNVMFKRECHGDVDSEVRVGFVGGKERNGGTVNKEFMFKLNSEKPGHISECGCESSKPCPVEDPCNGTFFCIDLETGPDTVGLDLLQLVEQSAMASGGDRQIIRICEGAGGQRIGVGFERVGGVSIREGRCEAVSPYMEPT